MSDNFMSDNCLLNNRYIRNFKSLTHKEQKKLGQSKVCIIGLGGLGGGVMEMLARIGIGSLKGIDNDKFDASNLNRQLFAMENLIGTSKAKAAENRIKSINSQIEIKCINKLLTQDNAHDLINDSDIVIDCLDSIKTRFILQDAAKKADIPLVSGAIAGASGQVSVIFPQDKGFELIYGKKIRENDKGVENELGNLSYCALFIAAIQTSESIKVLLKKGDVLRNKLLIVDLFSNSFEIIKLI
ncbi:MAG: HesA/MoeB/ThiF family protein [Desulfobacteraceae bacterium]|nr:HesA/MoeB/ThiF family protein [Desulfobacteraceae bacterium]